MQLRMCNTFSHFYKCRWRSPQKKIQKLEREQDWNVFWNFSAWLIDVIISPGADCLTRSRSAPVSLDKPNIMFTTTNVPKLYFYFFTSKIYKPVLASPAMYATLQIMLYGVNARPWTGDLGPDQDLTISEWRHQQGNHYSMAWKQQVFYKKLAYFLKFFSCKDD